LLYLLTVWEAIRCRLIRARDLIIDSAPILAWRRQDPDARVGHAPAQHAKKFLCGYRVHTLICRASGLPLLFFLAPANRHDAPFAKPLLAYATRLFHLHPQTARLDAAYWGLALIAWIHQTLGAVAVIPWNPKRQKNRSCLPPTWTRHELGKRSSIERFFARVFLFFRLQRPPLAGWVAVTTRVALTYTAVLIVALQGQRGSASSSQDEVFMRYTAKRFGEHMSTLTITELPVPLREDLGGVLRVGRTRVTLQTIIGAFTTGATAEEIAQRYPALDLGDIYAVIAYYLHHRTDVDAYLSDQRRLFEAVRREQEAHGGITDLRERLLARRNART
jgi:uncharacterized protein (DUF433 family)/transposase